MTSPNAALRRAGQSLTPGDLVALFVIDLASMGQNARFAFTTAADRARGPLVFRGVTYAPLDVVCDGFELTGRGAMPRPRLVVSNATRTLAAASLLYDDLVGATVIRTRTYAQFLDGADEADPEAAYAPDIYRVEQKTAHTKHQIEWSLAAAMDQEGRQLPGRMVLRDVCLWRYRRPVLKADGSFDRFDYGDVQCPYVGAQAYDAFGKPCDPEKDRPSRHVATCCKARFGSAAPLPFGGFPGVSRIRV